MSQFEVTIPEYEKVSGVTKLDLKAVFEAEGRLIEGKDVNAATYGALEYLYNEGYRQSKMHLATVSFQKIRAERQRDREKSRVILEVLPPLLEGKPASYNNSDFRHSILVSDEKYNSVCEHIDLLTSMEHFFETRISVFEKVCQYMRKQMDIQTKSTYNPRL